MEDDSWTAFLQRVKKRPTDFYAKCVELLLEQDLYEPSDLADLDFEMFKGQLEKSNATAGQRTFLELAADLAKAEKMQAEKLGDQFTPGPPAASHRSDSLLSNEPQLPINSAPSTAAAAPVLAPAPVPAPAAPAPAPAAPAPAPPRAPSAADEDDDAVVPGDAVAALVVPGTEDTSAVMKRGGMEIQWTAKDGTTRKVTKYRETAMRHIVDQDMALPTLYLHFLDKAFFVQEGEYNLSLRAGNDNSEIQLVLPEEMVPLRENIHADWRPSFDIVMRFIRGQAEVMSASVDEKPGGFGPKKNFKTAIQNQRLYFSVRTARPKAGVNLDKTAFGIPGEAELYLFAENHISVSHMNQRDIDAFNTCIEETLQAGAEVAKFGVFLKVFYEGGFAYNQKISMGKGYLPKTVGVACMSVVPAFAGQSGIATGYPYLLESRFLPFIDTVPVTIRAITDMSPRHARYGLCFTRCVFVWETDALAREGVLNFCSIVPHGGFFYAPATLRKHWKLGGLIYSFGEARDDLEAPVTIDSTSAAAAAAPSAAAGEPAPRLADYRACVICLTEDATCATVPCGHKAFCQGCSETARRRNCPVCRTFVTDVMRIYG